VYRKSHIRTVFGSYNGGLQRAVIIAQSNDRRKLEPRAPAMDAPFLRIQAIGHTGAAARAGRSEIDELATAMWAEQDSIRWRFDFLLTVHTGRGKQQVSCRT
jgi:hypothetical protein